jgi:ABC-type transporter Mla subunit MlaD
MNPDERFARIEAALAALAESQAGHEARMARLEKNLDRHIEFVGASLTRLEQQVSQTAQQVNRTAAAQEVTETRLRELITHVDRLVERMDRLDGGR